MNQKKHIALISLNVSVVDTGALPTQLHQDEVKHHGYFNA